MNCWALTAGGHYAASFCATSDFAGGCVALRAQGWFVRISVSHWSQLLLLLSSNVFAFALSKLHLPLEPDVLSLTFWPAYYAPAAAGGGLGRAASPLPTLILPAYSYYQHCAA